MRIISDDYADHPLMTTSSAKIFWSALVSICENLSDNHRVRLYIGTNIQTFVWQNERWETVAANAANDETKHVAPLESIEIINLNAAANIPLPPPSYAAIAYHWNQEWFFRMEWIDAVQIPERAKSQFIHTPLFYVWAARATQFFPYLPSLKHPDFTRDLVDQCPDLITIIDQNGVIVFINIACEKLIQYRQEEMIGHSVYEFVYPDDFNAVYEYHMASLQNSFLPNIQHRLIRKNGTPIWIESNIRFIPKTEGVSIFYCITREIELFKHAEQLWLDAQRMNKIGAWSYDLLENRMQWTEQVFRLHELPLNHIPEDDGSMKYIAPEYQPILLEKVMRCVEHFEQFEMELEMLTQKQKRFWVKYTCKPVVWKGKVVKLLGTIQDISAFKQVQMALSNYGGKLSVILQSLPYGILIEDKSGKIFTLNQKLMQAFDLEGVPEQYQGKKCSWLWEKIKPQMLEGYNYLNDQFWENAGNNLDQGVKIITQKQTILCMLRLPAMLEGKNNGFIWNFRDVTHEVEVNTALIYRESLYRDLLENMDQAIVIRDLTGRFIDFNKAFCKYTGYSKEELLDMSFDSLLHPEDKDLIFEKLNHFLPPDIKNIRHKIRLLTKEGQVRHFWIQSSIDWKDKKAQGFRDMVTIIENPEALSRKLTTHYHPPKHPNQEVSLSQSKFEPDFLLFIFDHDPDLKWLKILQAAGFPSKNWMINPPISRIQWPKDTPALVLVNADDWLSSEEDLSEWLEGVEMNFPHRLMLVWMNPQNPHKNRWLALGSHIYHGNIDPLEIQKKWNEWLFREERSVSDVYLKPKWIDLQKIRDFSIQNEAFVIKMANIYCQDVPLLWAQLTTDIQNKHWEAAARSFHQLKPSLLMVCKDNFTATIEHLMDILTHFSVEEQEVGLLLSDLEPFVLGSLEEVRNISKYVHSILEFPIDQKTIQQTV